MVETLKYKQKSDKNIYLTLFLILNWPVFVLHFLFNVRQVLWGNISLQVLWKSLRRTFQISLVVLKEKESIRAQNYYW